MGPRARVSLVGRWWTLPHAPAFHPTTHALFYGEAGFGALPLFAPIFLASGNPTLALNVTLLGGVALTATSLHLVIRRLTGSWQAGLVGGFVFLTTHWVLWYWIVIAPNYAASSTSRRSCCSPPKGSAARHAPWGSPRSSPSRVSRASTSPPRPCSPSASSR